MNEETFVRELERRAGDVHGAPFSFADVRGKARSIRRRRRAGVAGAVAAAVAIAVTVPAVLTGGLDRASGPQPATPPSSPTVTDTAVPATAALPTGFCVNGRVQSADGTSFRPDVSGEVSYLARLGTDRWVLAGYPEDAGFAVQVVDARGALLASYDALDGGLASADDDGAVAWIGPDGRPRVLVAGREEPVEVPATLSDEVAAPAPFELLPGCTAEECTLLVETYPEDGSTSTQAVGLDGTTSSFDTGGLLTVTDVSPDGTLVSGPISEESDGSCSAVVDREDGDRLWQTCDSSQLRFSPDGAHVLAIDAFLDGLGQSKVDVLDATTGEVRRHAEGTFLGEAWETADSYLVALVEEGSEDTVLVRFGLGEQDPEEVARPPAGQQPPGRLLIGR